MSSVPASIPPDLYSRFEQALRAGEAESAESLARQMLDIGIDPNTLVQGALVPILTEVGQQFQDFHIYLPELMMAGDAASRVTALLEQLTLQAGQAPLARGTVVIGQVEGDIHDIGRSIVRTLLASHAFRVVDLGHDVPASAFLEAAQKERADIVGLSALMTTTLPAQRRTLRLFEEVGQRQRYKIIIGGGAASQSWADEIHADGYAADAAAAVELCKQLIA